MRLFFFGFLLATVIACVHHQTHRPPTNWEFTCDAVSEVLEVQACAGLDAPQLIITDLTGALRAYGIYVHDEPYIFVDPDAPNIQATIRHEMVHYILWNNSLKDKCYGEALARKIADQDEPWRMRYRCPAK